jgi:hypothetical protein
MSYKNLFGDSNGVVDKKMNLFGETKQSNSRFDDIEAWLKENNLTTTSTRVDFILNGKEVTKLAVTDISDVGDWHVSEATEANRCVDNVVTEFAQLKTMLNEPKTLILEALQLIESSGKGAGIFGFLRSSKTDPAQVRNEVKSKLDAAMRKYQELAKIHIKPFLDGLADAKLILNRLYVDLDNTVNTLNYVAVKNPDQMVKDLALKRKEMFAKSLSLMVLNKSQLEQMEKSLSDSDTFADELGMTIIPLVENVIRNSMISGKDGLEDISKALKGIL